MIGETAAGGGSGGQAGGLVGEERGVRAREGKDGSRIAEEGSEHGSGEELGGKLQQAKGNVNEEETGGGSDDGWSADLPSRG